MNRAQSKQIRTTPGWRVVLVLIICRIDKYTIQRDIVFLNLITSMFEIGDQGMNEIISPPLSAAGLHRQNKQEVEITADQEEKTATDTDLTPQKTREGSNKKDSPTGCTKYFKLDYYKQYFDVCELDVISRLKASITVPPVDDFVERTNRKPDFYGPFWIMTTLVALLGVVGNLANYLLSKFSSEAVWDSYFFELAYFRYAFVFVYTYGLGVPAGIYFLFKVFSDSLKVELADIICVYGYSFSPFLAAVICSIIPIGIFQWLLILVAFAVSTYFLYVSLKNYRQRVNDMVLFGIIGGLQMVLTLTLKLQFLSLLS